MLKKLMALALIVCMLLPMTVLGEATYTLAGYEQTTEHNWANNFALERVSEATGVQFTYTQYTDADEWTKAKTQMLNGKDLPDVLFKANLTDDETIALYEAGVLIDLKPYLQENMPNLWALLQANPEWEKAITLPDGAIVTLPNINALQNNNAIWINDVWLKRLKLEAPTTKDELTAVLRAFKTGDPNNNGKADEVPLTFTGMWQLRFLAHAYGIYSNDYYVQTVDGVVKETVTSEENRAFLTWLHELWTEGLIDRNGFSSTESTRQITDSSATITYGIVMGPSIMNMLPSSELANYSVLMPMVYDGKQVYRQMLNEVSRGTFAVTKKCENVAAVLSWADLFYSEDGCYLVQAGKKDVEYRVFSDGTWNWIDDATTITETILPDYTIADGTLMPLYTSLQYQMNYDDESTHRAVVMLSELNNFSVSPYPLVYLDAATKKQIKEIWSKLGVYTETTMARFVTGDLQLNDQTWTEFCTQVNDLGMQEMVSIWQKIIQ